MFAVIFIFGDVFLCIAGKTAKIAKIRTRKNFVPHGRCVKWTYSSSYLACATCKSRSKPRAPLHTIPVGSPMKRITYIDIVGPLPSVKRKQDLTNRQSAFSTTSQKWALVLLRWLHQN